MAIRVVQLTDCHLFTDPKAELKGVRTRDCFEQALQTLRREVPHADAVIVTGDLAHDEQTSTYEAMRPLLAEEWNRLRVLPGNHDNRAAMRSVFHDRVLTIGDRNVFCDQVGTWRLIGLDSQVPGELHGELGIEQLRWLDDSLQSNPTQPTVLFVHHPPVEIGSVWLDRIGLQDHNALHAIVARQKNVKALCCGHVHQESATLFEQALLLTTPSTAVQFRPHRENLEVDSVSAGFRVLELFGNGSLTTRVVRV